MSVVSIFLDMTKAFDLVCHKTLIGKLERYGFRGNGLEWLASYLEQREQCVEILQNRNAQCSRFRCTYKRQNPYGVPQGSVLGPLLFLLYINDLLDHIDHECILYADDTTITVKCKDSKNLESKINNALKITGNWLDANNLSINTKKTKFVQFLTYKSKCANLRLEFNSLPLEEVDTVPFLGILLDKYCNWKDHVEKLCGKLDRFTYVLRRLSRTSSKKTSLLAYHGYVSSLLQYGLILWGNSVDANKVFIRQKACIRSITGAHFLDSCRPIFKQLRILPLPSLYIYRMLVFVKSNQHFFPIHEDNCNLRTCRQNKINIPRMRLTMYSKSAFCMAITLFNKLPDSLRDKPLTIFKKLIYNALLNKNYYDIKDYLSDDNILII